MTSRPGSGAECQPHFVDSRVMAAAKHLWALESNYFPVPLFTLELTARRLQRVEKTVFCTVKCVCCGLAWETPCCKQKHPPLAPTPGVTVTH